jgi:pimeloyl-ACP methyl ester carboxylesterase
MSIVAAVGLMASVQAGYAPVNGLNMYYEVHGRGRPDQVPLLLLHGGGSTIETSFGTLLPLLAKDRQVIAFEQQGHGHTADVARPFSFGQSAEDAVALLRYLKVAKADWFGYSNGGHIALQAAISHPEVVHSLILQSIMYSRDGADPRFWQSFDHAKIDDMPLRLKRAYLATAPHPEQLPVFFDKSVQRMRSFKGWTPEQIRSVKAKVLLVVGDRDVVTVEHAAQMQRLLQDAQLAVLPATDHLQMTQRADRVAPLVDDFLAQPSR